MSASPPMLPVIHRQHTPVLLPRRILLQTASVLTMSLRGETGIPPHIRIVAVSYTHLDVYKRQVPCRRQQGGLHVLTLDRTIKSAEAVDHGFKLRGHAVVI